MNSPITSASATTTLAPSNASRILTLLVLAPLIGEVLSGATRLSFLFVFIPEVMVWGCGALISRELVRRWRGGATSLLMLGLALSVAEEFIIQQTSLAPLPWLASTTMYGRQWGVNWLYFLFMLGYESVWIVLVPVQLTELIFPERRRDPWLKNRGLIISSFVFLLGSFLAWFLWTQRARPLTYHVAPYQPARLLLFLGALAILLLVIAAYLLRRSGHSQPSPSRNAPSPWIVGLTAFVFGSPWYLLMTLVFSPSMKHNYSFWVPMMIGTFWGILAFVTIRYYSSASGWTDMHRWAVVLGATLVCMLLGFSGSSSWPRADIVFKAILNVIAVAGFVLLARRVSRAVTIRE